jgi:cellobiose phosphorylase
VIPEAWEGFRVRRVFRGVTYHIALKRGGKGNTVALEVDGRAVAGNVVPLPRRGASEVKVDVTLGD